MTGFSKLAIVSDISWVRHSAKIFGPLVPAQLHVFALAELDEARTAIRSLPILEPPVALDVPAIQPGRFRRVTRGAWAAAAAVVLIAGAGAVGLVRGAPESESVDLDSVLGQHTARVSVDPGVTSVRAITAVSRQ